MKTQLITIAAAGTIALAGCQMTATEAQVAGGLIGATAGLITASALNANTEWTILTVLAGAAAGTLVAKNNTTNQCAYANGNGTYYTAPCP